MSEPAGGPPSEAGLGPADGAPGPRPSAWDRYPGKVRPIVWWTLAFALAALAVSLRAPPSLRRGAWLGLGVAYLALCTWGTVSLRSGLFGWAWWRAPSPRPEVALTFDDGPDPRATPALLDLLRERGVAATFFCVGRRVHANLDVATRCVEEGHLLGNHSYHHLAVTNLLPGFLLRRELQRCQDTLAPFLGAPPRYLRPPMGLCNHVLAPVAWSLGLELTGWQVRGLDTTSRTPEEVVQRVLSRVRPGGIVCLHDGGQDPARVVTIARGVLDGLAEQGLTPVRLDRLLEGGAPGGPSRGG